MRQGGKAKKPTHSLVGLNWDVIVWRTQLILCGVLCETGWQGKKTHTFSCGIELWSSLVVEHSLNLIPV